MIRRAAVPLYTLSGCRRSTSTVLIYTAGAITKCDYVLERDIDKMEVKAIYQGSRCGDVSRWCGAICCSAAQRVVDKPDMPVCVRACMRMRTQENAEWNGGRAFHQVTGGASVFCRGLVAKGDWPGLSSWRPLVP